MAELGAERGDNYIGGSAHAARLPPAKSAKNAAQKLRSQRGGESSEKQNARPPEAKNRHCNENVEDAVDPPQKPNR